MTAEESQILTLPNGRTLGYAIYGSPPAPEVPTIFYLHGFCTSRLEASYLAATKAKPYIIAIDRPGTGLSSFQPSRRILDWPADVLAVADHLKTKEFHVVGASGGGPYALVCAKEISRARLLSVSVVSGIYPLSIGTQGMIFGVKAVLLAGIWLPTILMGKLLDWEFGNAARNEDPKVFEDVFMKGMDSRNARDRSCLDDILFRNRMIESMREAFRQGAKGLAWESGLFGDWGFEIRDLDRDNVLLWHGKDDANAPCAIAEKAARLIKGSKLRLVVGESHMSLSYYHIAEISQAIADLELGKKTMVFVAMGQFCFSVLNWNGGPVDEMADLAFAISVSQSPRNTQI